MKYVSVVFLALIMCAVASVSFAEDFAIYSNPNTYKTPEQKSCFQQFEKTAIYWETHNGQLIQKTDDGTAKQLIAVKHGTCFKEPVPTLAQLKQTYAEMQKEVKAWEAKKK
jgi:hypothetical protein